MWRWVYNEKYDFLYLSFILLLRLIADDWMVILQCQGLEWLKIVDKRPLGWLLRLI